MFYLTQLELDDGETNRTEPCPACGENQGGSFAVTRSGDKVLYKCHRAKCGYAGAVSYVVEPTTTPKSKDHVQDIAKKRYQDFVEKIVYDKKKVEELWTKAGIFVPLHVFAASCRGEREWDIGTFRDECCLIYGLPSVDGFFNYQLRWYDGRKPKTLTYKHPSTAYPVHGLYKQGPINPVKPRSLIVVEDPVSALGCWSPADDRDVLCLTGTHMSRPLLNWAADHYGIIKVWLDYDAVRQATNILDQLWQRGVYNATLIHTRLDPKNLTQHERSSRLR